MPEARRELVSAAISYAHSRENRLTELFATVLASHDTLTAALFEDVGLPIGERFRVYTQRRVAPGCIPDLVVESWRAAGGRVSQLWSEHKTTSGFRHEQREDYVRALSSEPGVGQLLTITTEHTGDHAGAWERRTWRDVGELIDRVGRDSVGPRWRESALAPESPARVRLLHELLWYLEREGFAVVRPLSSDDVSVLSHFHHTIDVVLALVERASEHIGGLVAGSVEGDDMWLSWWFHITPPDGHWLHRVAPHEGWCEVMLCVSDPWWPEGTDQPAVAAGYTFPPQLHGALSVDPDWLDRLEEAGYTLEPWEGWLRCWRTRPLASLVDAGDRLDAQAKELARWARDSIEALGSLDPGELEVPAPKRGGGGDASSVASGQ